MKETGFGERASYFILMMLVVFALGGIADSLEQIANHLKHQCPKCDSAK